MNDSAQIPRGIQTESVRNPDGIRADSKALARAPAPASDPIRSHPISNTKNKLTPKPDTHTTSGHTSDGNGHGNGHGHDATDQAGTFIAWFHQEYKLQRHGADYLVHRKKDEPIVRYLLKHFPVGRLQDLAKILLSDKTDDSFIQTTDRGISILKIKANWLNDRLCALEHRNGLN